MQRQGDAIAHYGRIHKTLHVLTYIDDETYRRGIKAQTNLQESRHDLGRQVFHGQRGELRRRYHAGMEDQLSALGLVLNCIPCGTPSTSTLPSTSCAGRDTRSATRT